MWLRPSQLSQQKPEIQIYPGKICVGPSCLMNWIPMTYMKVSPGIWKWYVSSNTTSALDWKGRRRHKMKESCWTPKFPQTVNKQADKIYSVETTATLQGKESMTLRAESWAWRVELQAQRVEPRAQRIIRRPWKPNGLWLTGFQNCWELVIPFFFPFSPFGNWNISNCYSMAFPSLYCGSK